jgi:NAD-dependent dihydropyrimidine dehydrogenase PreA subunit
MPTEGARRPVVDYNRCEGKAACVAVCPSGVFDLRMLSGGERGPLSLGGRVRRLLHGGPQAWVARPDQCQACGRCVTECPEEAIRLEPAGKG